MQRMYIDYTIRNKNMQTNKPSVLFHICQITLHGLLCLSDKYFLSLPIRPFYAGPHKHFTLYFS